MLTPLGGWLLDRSGDRVNVWHNSLSLVRDYPLTGMGLGSYEMAYASYALLTHVGYIAHAHNLLLDVWLSLGALGLIALLGIIANAMWPKPSSPWRMAALASLSMRRSQFSRLAWVIDAKWSPTVFRNCFSPSTTRF